MLLEVTAARSQSRPSSCKPPLRKSGSRVDLSWYTCLGTLILANEVTAILMIVYKKERISSFFLNLDLLEAF